MPKHIRQELFIFRPAIRNKKKKEVYDVVPLSADGSDGYEIKFKDSLSWFPKCEAWKQSSYFAGGVLGFCRFIEIKRNVIANSIGEIGSGVRTNSESLIVTTFDDVSFSEGIAIGSIVNIDESRHRTSEIFRRSRVLAYIYRLMDARKNILFALFNMVKEFVL